MAKIIIEGGTPLQGTVTISGAKNAVLPIIAASLLAGSESNISGIPDLEDVRSICLVLEALGAQLEHTEGTGVTVRPGDLVSYEPPYELVRKMRASFLVMGPLLARLGKAKVSLPGGCAIGTRPVDLHLKGFEALGAKITTEHGAVQAEAKRLKGARIYLDFPSVGATENIMMAATLAQGETYIENAAEEPEVVDLANYLNIMGAKIKGAGTKIIRIKGVKELQGTNYTVIPDRIEAGTYMVAAAISRGDVLLQNVIIDHLKPIIAKLQEIGIKVREENGGLRVRMLKRPQATDIKTLPYPGFPTDMQPQLMALLALAKGTSVISETVFENRFMHVAELKRMGANIRIEGCSAVIEGVNKLTAAPVRVTDLRAGAALILAGLAAEGITEIGDVYHIDRGYVNLEQKLSALGACISRVDDDVTIPREYKDEIYKSKVI
ncbi:MAG: UDP-N-acetylglucosamine 1-carboxyvinyltransferase [bacterium]